MNKIQLPTVTLMTTTSVRLPEHIEAIKKCCENIKFGKVILVSHELPKDLPDYVEYKYYPEIRDIMDFNILMFRNVGKFVETSHALFCQDHAFVTNPELWDNDWLQYDYIGAPWPIRENSYIDDNGERVRVGNGGFSLRSSKLMQLPLKLNIPLVHEQGFYNEDGNICCYHKSKFLAHGIKYAPVEVAAKFSYENPVPENQGIPSFGFHRFQNPANQNKNFFNSISKF